MEEKITVQVGEEIKCESRIFWGLTPRQFVSGAVGLIMIIIFYVTVHPQIKDMIPFSLFFVGIPLYFFVGYTKNGLHIEYFALKFVKQVVLQNKHRKYKTSNKCVEILNSAYQQDALEDMKNSRKKRIIERTNKKNKKKTSRLKAYI